MPTPITTSDQQGFDSIDPTAAEKAFERLRPRLLALPKETLVPLSVDLERAAIAAAAVARFIKDPKVRARFLSLPKAEFDHAHLDDLEPVVLAAWFAAIKLKTASADGSEVKVPLSLVQKATAIKERMLTLLSYHFGDDPKEGKEITSIKQGSGYADLASDLVRLAALYKKHHARVKLDPKNYVATDARDAKKHAHRIIEILGDDTKQEQKLWTDLMLRTWTLLTVVYGEVAAAGEWLFRHEGGETRFPSLYVVGRRPKARKAKTDQTIDEEEEQEADEGEGSEEEEEGEEEEEAESEPG